MDPAERQLKARLLVARSSGDPFRVCEALVEQCRWLCAHQRWEDAHEALNDVDFVLMQKPECLWHARSLRERADLFRQSGLEHFAEEYAARADEVERRVTWSARNSSATGQEKPGRTSGSSSWSPA
ncbi:MAG: hypothetical protein AB1758_01645 [Candidatus Eremiobacterota bacterium]